jgi:hypothetical protein
MQVINFLDINQLMPYSFIVNNWKAMKVEKGYMCHSNEINHFKEQGLHADLSLYISITMKRSQIYIKINIQLPRRGRYAYQLDHNYTEPHEKD